MAKFVPKDKLSKKARKELDSQRRMLWQYSPATTRIESKKLYNRKKKSHASYDENGMGFCSVMFKRYVSYRSGWCCGVR